MMTGKPQPATARVVRSWPRNGAASAIVAVICWYGLPASQVDVTAAGPVVLDPGLTVGTVVTGLSQPTSMAFIRRREILVLEKATGKVQRVIRRVIQATPALDLAVNSASERGLLGIALHPDFPTNPGVYLYWTESSATDVTGQPIDTTDVSQTPLLGNRVDRFVWNGSTLTFDRNLIRLRAFQADEGQPLRGNHNGGVIRFARRGDPSEPATLFIIIGDEGRRGQMQNLQYGPFGDGSPDDQFGGPEPDDAHLTGVVLRLNDDGTAPPDNPFYRLGARIGGEVGANLQKVFAYGIRNSFGMAIDPLTGDLWNQENGDDSFDEINRITPGQNNGWIQVMGPISRVAQFKEIETTPGFEGLQQIRWPPSNIADTPEEARERLFMLRGTHYRDPVFSWKFAVAPAAIGFLESSELGLEYAGDLFVGAARTFLDEGYLMRFELTETRRQFRFSDARLRDRVADNTTKFDATESESLRFGTGFGISTDIQTGPNGHLFVLSLTNGAIYEVRRAR